jgi:hypothetical protein
MDKFPRHNLIENDVDYTKDNTNPQRCPDRVIYCQKSIFILHLRILEHFVIESLVSRKANTSDTIYVNFYLLISCEVSYIFTSN